MAKATATRKKSAKKSAKRKPGRPLAKVDEERVGELAFKGLSDRKIGVLVGINRTSLAERFLPLLTKKRAERTEFIRSGQMAVAGGAAGPKSQATMLIWLGKNELGQSDKAAVEHSGGLTVKVTITADKGAAK